MEEDDYEYEEDEEEELRLYQPSWSWSDMREFSDDEEEEEEGVMRMQLEEEEEEEEKKRQKQKKKEKEQKGEVWTLDFDSEATKESQKKKLKITIPTHKKTTPPPSPTYLGKILSEIRRKTSLPEWMMEKDQGNSITMDLFKLAPPVTIKEWSQVEMEIEVFHTKGKTENDRGRTIILFCSIPDKSSLVKMRLALALFAAQMCSEVLRKESLAIQHVLGEETKKVDVLQKRGYIPIQLGAIFLTWWYYQRDKDFYELFLFRGRRKEDTKFVAYLLGQGKMTDRSLAKKREFLRKKEMAEIN